MNDRIKKFGEKYGYTSKVEQLAQENLDNDQENVHTEDIKDRIASYMEQVRSGSSLTQEQRNEIHEMRKQLSGKVGHGERKVEEYTKKLASEIENEPTDEQAVEIPKFDDHEEYQKIEEELALEKEQRVSVEEELNSKHLVILEENDDSNKPFEKREKNHQSKLLEKIKSFKDSFIKKVKNRPENYDKYILEKDTFDVLKRRIDNFSSRIENLRSHPSAKENKNTISIIKERIRILEERSAKLESRIANYEERKDSLAKQFFSRFKRGFNTVGNWYEEAGGTKKLSKRLVVSIGISSALGLLGFGGSLASVIGGVPGAYFGQGVGRKVYDRFIRKDFRRDLVKLRKEGLQNSRELEYEGVDQEVLEERKQKYSERLNAINDRRLAKNIKRSERFKTLTGVLGGALFSGITRQQGAELLKSIGVPDINVGEQIGSWFTPQKDTVENIASNLEAKGPYLDFEGIKPTSEIDTRGINLENIDEAKEHIPNYEDIKINKGEGITHAFVRQIKNNPELKAYFGLGDNPSNQELIQKAVDAAYKTGYLSDTEEVRVFLDSNAGYELKIENGKLVAQEYENIVKGDNGYTGDIKESHQQGSAFEKDIEKNREYHTERGALEINSKEVEVDNLKGKNIDDTFKPNKKEFDLKGKNLDDTFLDPKSELKGVYHGDDFDFKGENLDDILLNNEKGLKGVYKGPNLDDTFLENKIDIHEKVFSKVERKFQSLPGFTNIGGTELGNHLGAKYHSLSIPSYIINLFQDRAHPETFMRVDDRLINAMGLDLNTDSFRSKDEIFKIRGTDKKVGWKWIYEHVNLEKLKKLLN